MRREWCIGERVMARMYNVTIYERVLRQERRRGDVDRGDRVVVFAIRSGETQGPQIDEFVVASALSGSVECLSLIARRIEEFYR